MLANHDAEDVPGSPSKEGFAHILSCLEDGRRLIAANKVQRWEVFKWAIAVNLTLASASVLIKKSPSLFVLGAVGTALIAFVFIEHYHGLIERSRVVVFKLGKYLDRAVFDVSQITDRGPLQMTGPGRDRRELQLMRFGIALSIIPSATAFFL